MSPRKTFHNVGSSSSFVWRRNLPSRVIRSSPFRVICGPSREDFIVRNLTRLNLEPWRPTLFCRKKTGRPEVMAMPKPSTPMTGAVMISPITAIPISTHLGMPVLIPSSANCSSPAASAGMLSTDSLDTIDDMLSFCFPHSRKNWETDQAFPFCGRHRKVARAPSERVSVVRMRMQRPPVNGTADASTLEFIDELVAVDVQVLQFQPDWKQVPRKDAIRFARRQLDLFKLRKTFD